MALLYCTLKVFSKFNERDAAKIMPSFRFKGIIFDMDGVLVDSEKLYMRFWQESCAFFGYDLTPEMALSLRSNSAETAIPKFIDWFGETVDYYKIRELRRRLMADFIDKNGVEIKPGAIEIFNYLKQNGLKIALATASPVKRAIHYLEPYGLFDMLDAVVNGTSVAKSKPAPDIYIAAAEKLGFSPCECIAVEDSPAGIISAKTAGCFTVMVPDLTPADNEISGYVDYLAADLNDIIKIL